MHASDSRLHRGARALLPWLLGAVGVCCTFWPTLLSCFRLVPGGESDARLVLYLLEHSYRWLQRVPGHERLWDAPFFFPEANVVAYSELMAGVAPPYWMLRFAGVPPYAAYSAWLVALCVANYAVALFVLRRLVPGSGEWAALGAYVFAYANPRIAQFGHGHPHLVAQFFPLLTIFAIVRALQAHSRGDPRSHVGAWLLSATLAEVVQLHASVHHAWFVAFALIVSFALALTSRPYRAFLTSFVRTNATWLAGCALVGVALASPLVRHYLMASRVAGSRSYEEMLTYAPRPWSWVFMGPENTLYGWLLGTRHSPLALEEGEQQLGVGLITATVALWGLWAERGKPLFDLLLGLAVVTVVLVTMWLPPLTLWIPVFAALPGARAIRATSRIVLLLLIPLAFGAAAAAARMKQRRRLVLPVLCAAIVAESLRHTATYDWHQTNRRELALAARISPACTAFFALRPDSSIHWIVWQVDAMWASLRTGVPTVNGYSGVVPPTLAPLRNATASAPWARDSVPAIIQRWLAQHGRRPAESCLILPQ